MSVPANAIQGGLAFNAALGDARNFVNEAFARYGWQMPTATGSYTSAAAGEAFDPNLTLSFDPNTGAMTSKMPTQATGQYGTTGLFAETAQAGASGEADVTSELRSRGIMTGGLAGQRRQLAETMAGKQMGQVSSELFGGISEAYGNVGQSYLNYLIGKATGEQTGASAKAETMPVTSTTVTPPAAPVAPVAAPTATPSLNQIRTKPQGASLTADEFKVVLNANRSSISALRSMLNRWGLTPAQKREVNNLIR